MQKLAQLILVNTAGKIINRTNLTEEDLNLTRGGYLPKQTSRQLSLILRQLLHYDGIIQGSRQMHMNENLNLFPENSQGCVATSLSAESGK